MIFDWLTRPTSPLRSRLVAIAFWSLAPEMDDPAAAATYFAECQTGEKRYVNGEQMAAQTKLRANAYELVNADPRLAKVGALVDGRECAVSVEEGLAERRNELAGHLRSGRRRRAAGVRRSEKEPLLRPVDTMILGPAAAFLALGALSLLVWGNLLISLFVTSPSWILGFIFALEWRRRFLSQRRRTRFIAREERLMANFSRSLEMIGEIARFEPALSVLGARDGSEDPEGTATASGDEESLRAVLAAMAAQNSDQNGPLDIHYFLRAAAAVLNHAKIIPDDRSVTAPARLWRRLSGDHCFDLEGVFGPATAATFAAHEDSLVPEGPLARAQSLGWDLITGPEGALEVRCHLLGEADLTVIRLALPKPVWMSLGPGADNANLVALRQMVRQIARVYP